MRGEETKKTSSYGKELSWFFFFLLFSSSLPYHFLPARTIFLLSFSYPYRYMFLTISDSYLLFTKGQRGNRTFAKKTKEFRNNRLRCVRKTAPANYRLFLFLSDHVRSKCGSLRLIATEGFTSQPSTPPRFYAAYR